MADLYLAGACFEQFDPDIEKKFLRVMEDYKVIGYPYLHFGYSMLSSVQSHYGNSDKAMFYAREAVRSVEASKDTSAASDMYLMFACMLERADEFETAIEIAYKAVEMYKVLPGQLFREDLVAVVPQILRKLKRYDEALVFMDRIQNDFPPVNIYQEFGYIRDIANIYRDMKQYKKAEKYYLQMLEIAERGGIVHYGVYKSVAQLYVESHQYEKARVYPDKIPSERTSDFNQGGWSHLLYMRYLTDSATGDYLSAMKLRNEMIRLDEMRVREAREKEVKKLSIQYETEKKPARSRCCSRRRGCRPPGSARPGN